MRLTESTTQDERGYWVNINVGEYGLYADPFGIREADRVAPFGVYCGPLRALVFLPRPSWWHRFWYIGRRKA